MEPEAYYSFIEVAEAINITYSKVSAKCKKMGFTLLTGRNGIKYVNQNQYNILLKLYNHVPKRPVMYELEIIRITETYHIFESKLNTSPWPYKKQ